MLGVPKAKEACDNCTNKYNAFSLCFVILPSYHQYEKNLDIFLSSSTFFFISSFSSSFFLFCSCCGPSPFFESDQVMVNPRGKRPAAAAAKKPPPPPSPESTSSDEEEFQASSSDEFEDPDDIEDSDDDEIEFSEDEEFSGAEDEEFSGAEDDEDDEDVEVDDSEDEDNEDDEICEDEGDDDEDDDEEEEIMSTDGIASAAAILRARGFKSHLVTSREDTLKYDLGNLVAFDSQPVDAVKYATHKEKALSAGARESTQLLFNRIFSLETRRLATEGVIAVLPKPVTALPRSKHVPEKKPTTKWEQFASARGILNRKRERMLWDETHQEWRPRWGYKRANDELGQWLIEDKGTTSAGQDPWQVLKAEKKDRVKLNKKQAYKNKHRHDKELPGQADTSGTLDRLAIEKQRIKSEVRQANASSASIGHFNQQLP
ncbi:MAG: ribosome biogenesis regulatory protein homolog, partial [Phycisphaerales bacterium]|nr:ribosome biogenesis regulatory protein homolog [Phycisphaerales bacterium]